MRLVAIAAFFLLALAGLTILPMAAADPACTTDLCGPFPPEPSCSEKSFMVLGDDTNTLTTHSDCTATLETGKGQICVGAWSTTDEHQIGPLHWTDHRCTFPGGDPVCCLSAAPSSSMQAPPPCYWSTCPTPACRSVEASDGTVWGAIGNLVRLGMVYNGPHAGARLNSDCTADAWETNFPCEPNLLPLASDQVHEDVGRAEVTADTCTIGFICACMPVGTDSASAPQVIPPCQCPPPQPLCQNVNRILAPGNGPVRYELTDYCHVTVIIDGSQTCGLQGTEWTVITENPVELRYKHCQSPPPQLVDSESANPFPTCVRECLPGPDGCTLRDATPAAGPSVGPITPIALRQAIWGNDCTIDLDPIGACAPPSGSSKDVTVAFVHLHLLLCGGNPPPIWS